MAMMMMMTMIKIKIQHILTLDSTPVARANEVRARKASFMMTD